MGKTQPACQRVMKVPGVGLMTATYLWRQWGMGNNFIQRNNCRLVGIGAERVLKWR
ncbi:transposase [Yersinia enterocolitica subsp. palearctica Y11]|uniref:Transposase n=1 Tax=Yersinia enterocolitica subsp. palearctica serotype O:3 (strain DSM 13030 / CIP 106945 / Y11) TaxID=930944 RepID=A0A0H3NWU1_YERE1|nr:transposase [Yersinia enterocolitica subsp. palearctica Y11]